MNNPGSNSYCNGETGSMGSLKAHSRAEGQPTHERCFSLLFHVATLWVNDAAATLAACGALPSYLGGGLYLAACGRIKA